MAYKQTLGDKLNDFYQMIYHDIIMKESVTKAWVMDMLTAEAIALGATYTRCSAEKTGKGTEYYIMRYEVRHVKSRFVRLLV
jgi:hypothetical protein